MAKSIHPNRNARRSIRLLEEAFIGLLMEEPYDKITVTQVVNRADLNRSTFYAHFEDVDDLARDVSGELADQIMVIISPMLKGDFYRDPLPLLDKIGTFVVERRDLFARLAQSGGPGSFIELLVERVRGQIRDEFAERAPDRAARAMVACDYIAAGLLWTGRSWLVGEFGDVDPKEITRYLAGLVQATSTAWADDAADSDDA